MPHQMPSQKTSELLLPRLGETMDEGTVVAWLVDEGETFKRGQAIAEIETDKTVVELPALSDGTMSKIMVKPGKKVAVGTTLAMLQDAGIKHPRQQPITKKKIEKTKKAKRVAPKKNVNGLTSPNARRVARELGVSLENVVPTGRRGRATARDVLAAARKTSAKGIPKPSATTFPIYHWQAKSNNGSPALFLVHGLFGNAAAWNGVAANLSHTGTNVYAVDLPGHGQSSSPLTDPVAMANEALEALRDSIEGPVKIAGISFGAIVATEIAARHDNCVELMLICPAGLGRISNASFLQGMLAAAFNNDPELLSEQLSEQGASLGLKAIKRNLKEISGNAKHLEQIALGAFPHGSQSIDITSKLAQLKVPVRSLFSLDDKVFPWQDAANLPPNVAAHFIQEAGHLPMFSVQDKVVSFLTGY